MNAVVFVVLEEDRGYGVSVCGVYFTREAAEANCDSNYYIEESVLIGENI